MFAAIVMNFHKKSLDWNRTRRRLGFVAIAIVLIAALISNGSTQLASAASCVVLPVSKVTAVGNEVESDPENVIDGKLNSRWSNEGRGSWINIDLGKLANVCSVDIAWYKGNMRQNTFAISHSMDTKSYSQIFSGKSSGTTTSFERYDFADVITKHIRITVNGNTENNWASITEIKVYGYFTSAQENAISNTLTVRSVDLSGNTITGMYTTIRSSSGTVLQTGFTPLTFTGNAGSTYSVTVSDYGQRKFDHWENGAEGRTRTVTLSKDTTVTAYYATGAPIIANPELTVRSVDLSGNTITGMYTTIRSSSGTVLQTGFTPLTFTGNAGSTYSVTVSDYGQRKFDHWENGAEGRTRTVTLSKDTTVTAYYVIEATSPVPTPQPDKITGVYVPLYMYPSSSGWTHWQKVINEKNAHPELPFYVTINPNSGAGSFKDSNFATGISKLKAADITVLGYIAIDYGTRSMSSVRAEIDRYTNWYDIDGIMVDEFPNKVANLDYAKDLYAYAKSKGLYVKANPGTDIPESFVNTADNFSISEGSGYFDINKLAGWHTKYEKSKWSFTRHSTPSLDEDFVEEAAEYVGMMYVTDGLSPTRYHHIPHYFDEMVDILDDLR